MRLKWTKRAIVDQIGLKWTNVDQNASWCDSKWAL